MALRFVLFVLVTVALATGAWAHCPAGMAVEAAVHGHGAHGEAAHDHGKKDCDSKEKRACDAMVQAAPSPAPALAAPVGWTAPHFVVAPVLVRVDLLAANPRARPPDRISRYRDISARTGRLLI